jgi:hypothetical protein
VLIYYACNISETKSFKIASRKSKINNRMDYGLIVSLPPPSTPSLPFSEELSNVYRLPIQGKFIDKMA